MPQQQGSQFSQKEGRIALAIQAFERGQFKSLKATTKSYDVSYSTIQDRVNGRSSRHDSEPRNQKLTTTKESTLVQWILSIDQRGLPPRPDSVRQMANLLLEKRSDLGQGSGSGIGKHQVINFVQRHQALQTRYNRKYNYQQAKYEDPAIIREQFHLVQNTIAKYSIQNKDIYNFDKTGFQIGVISTTKVVTRAERSN